MTYQYDDLVFIGRFQLPHYGHLAVIDAALERASRVIVVVGSCGGARNLRNPFTAEERISMLLMFPSLQKAFDDCRLVFECIEDYLYSDQEWVAAIQESITQLTGDEGSIGLIGHAKDNTSYYLNLFPQWESESVENVRDISSTKLRQLLYSAQLYHNNRVTHPDIIRWCQEFMLTDSGTKIVEEYRWVQKYKEMWAAAPYPVIFNTVDAVVVQSGHVLLVKRGAMPGKGLWALPGGYINPEETLEQSMLRELNEETRLQKNYPTLRPENFIVKSETFADPHRSARGRVITHAYLIKLPDRQFLPKVKGSDDAVKAKWVPLSQIRADEMFEDHHSILRKMTAGL